MIKEQKKEWGTILAIILIASLVSFFTYFFFFSDLEKKAIEKNKNNVEVINNQKNTLDDTEIDIKEIERRLDELDVNVDDIFEQL